MIDDDERERQILLKEVGLQIERSRLTLANLLELEETLKIDMSTATKEIIRDAIKTLRAQND